MHAPLKVLKIKANTFITKSKLIFQYLDILQKKIFN